MSELILVLMSFVACSNCQSIPWSGDKVSDSDDTDDSDVPDDSDDTDAQDLAKVEQR
jgi:hypothetical protein